MGCSMDPTGEVSAPFSSASRRSRWVYIRWAFWAMLLGAAVVVWAVSRLDPQLTATLAGWIAQLQTPSVSAAQQEAEQAAAQALRTAGALVIDEGPHQGVTSVHFLNPKSLSDQVLQHLPDLIRVNSLNFTGMPLRDEQLVYVAKARSLASLVLNNTPITDAGLAHLAPLNQLEVLHLRKTPISDSGLASLAALEQLKVLDLSETRITDQGLLHLQKLPQLRWLLLDETAVTDQGLQYLQAFPQLSQVNLRHTRVSTEGIGRLKKALPHLYVDHR